MILTGVIRYLRNQVALNRRYLIFGFYKSALGTVVFAKSKKVFSHFSSSNLFANDVAHVNITVIFAH